MLQAEVFAGAASAPRQSAAFLARLRELLADPSQIDESEWELATDPPRIVQRYSAPMRSLVGGIVGRVDVYTDITQARRLYTQLLNSEKLRAIGEMASGVAHDFNNVLASIVGQTELLHLGDQPPTTRLAISTIRQAALDGARMVRNLQGLARPRAETPSTAAVLNETVQLAVEMARPRWAGAALHGRGPIEVHLNLPESVAMSRVAIDPAELREVLLNLLFNATDAMPDGGRIDIATRTGRKPGTADLEVKDTGHGMPETVRAHIFEPFFSTKGPKGSGLGLAVAYSISHSHSPAGWSAREKRRHRGRNSSRRPVAGPQWGTHSGGRRRARPGRYCAPVHGTLGCVRDGRTRRQVRPGGTGGTWLKVRRRHHRSRHARH